MAAYEKIYLNDNRKITKYLFHLFMRGTHDFFGCIEKYMEISEIRKKMDEGNWSALNKGIKQLYNSVDLRDVPLSDNAYMDGIMSDWIADVYVYFQWMYALPSAELVRHMPPAALYRDYDPLHETSISNACEKLYKKYFRSERG